jgi:phosphopantothenoylcysteine synthetase/decarboxylase
VNRPILYAIACASPPARYIGRLVEVAHASGWEVCVITTPDGRHFVDAAALAAATGYPVRSSFKFPGDLDVLPDPNAIIVAPATVNTITKWSLGIADTLALGLLVESQGKGLPIVAVPFTNTAMAAHPAFLDSIDRLRRWGVSVVFGEDVLKLHPPGTGEERAADFPWHLPWNALAEIYPG